MDICLHRPYTDGGDGIYYPVHNFNYSDELFLCIVYSPHHDSYDIRVVAKETFINGEYYEADHWHGVFEDIPKDKLDYE